MTKKKEESICNSDLYGINQNEENEENEEIEHTNNNDCQSSCQSSCFTANQNEVDDNIEIELKDIRIKHFWEQNKRWINFLDMHIKGIALISHIIKAKDSECQIQQKKVDYTKKSNDLKILEKCSLITFENDGDFVICIGEWILQNVKNPKDCIVFTNKVNWVLIENILNKISVSYINGNPTNILGYQYNLTFESVIPFIIKYIHEFLIYFDNVKKYGYQAPLGIYKVGICEFYLKKEKRECQKIYVTSKGALACLRHRQSFRFRKYQDKIKNTSN